MKYNPKSNFAYIKNINDEIKIVKNTNDMDILDEFANSSKYQVRLAVLEHNIPKYFDKMVNDRAVKVRVYVAIHGSDENRNILIYDDSFEVVCAILEYHPSSNFFHIAAKHINQIVRSCVTKNCDDVSILELLSSDDMPYITRAAKKRIQDLKNEKSRKKYLKTRDVDGFLKSINEGTDSLFIQSKLEKHESEHVRLSLLRSNNRYLGKYINDPSDMIREYIARYGTVSHRSRLILDKSPNVIAAILDRQPTNNFIQIALKNHGNKNKLINDAIIRSGAKKFYNKLDFTDMDITLEEAYNLF